MDPKIPLRESFPYVPVRLRGVFGTNFVVIETDEKLKISSIEIDPSLMERGRVKDLQDLLTATVNEAVQESLTLTIAAVLKTMGDPKQPLKVKADRMFTILRDKNGDIERILEKTF